MRRASLTFGLAGGMAGMAVHAYLLLRLLEQTGPAAGQVEHLAVGVALGAAGVAAALAVRASRPVSAVFLLSLGALGLFPNLLSWAPAAALMITAGTLGVVDLRRSPTRSGQPSAGRATAQAADDGTPLHWSMAPRSLRGPQARPSPPSACPAASERTENQDVWSLRSKTLVIAAVLATAAVVVPFSLWPQEAKAAAFESTAAATTVAGPATTATAAAGSTTTTPPAASTAPAGAAPAAGAAEQPGGASTTTLPTSLTRVGPFDASDPGGSVLYSDVRFGLTVAVPASWAEVSPSSLADYNADAYHLAGFADLGAATLQNAYLNGVSIEVLAGSPTENPPEDLMKQALQRILDQGPNSYDYFKVLKSIHSATVGSVAALSATVRFTWNKRVMVKSIYTLIASHCLYQIEVQTDDADWNAYQDLFNGLLASFTFPADTTGR